MSRDGRPYEPARPGVAQEYRWDTATYLRFAPKLFTKVRDVYGEGPHLLHDDVHHRCSPIEAARLARELEPFHLFWLEDAVAAELQGVHCAWSAAISTTPLAIGEVFNSILRFHDAACPASSSSTTCGCPSSTGEASPTC